MTKAAQLTVLDKLLFEIGELFCESVNDKFPQEIKMIHILKKKIESSNFVGRYIDDVKKTVVFVKKSLDSWKRK
ncbi:MAG: hypothetical protein A3F91_09345 [Flavobacteria bacterium RIFCSPLOWO2_12_FULL_35_11]|nr:MAG: hypothetical protein A3F91_09345 [Flavobacteria bacterium RIFCSPLOWO2_12_FULL_35_11]